MANYSAYTTRELSSSTWPDFVKLFENSQGDPSSCWCMFYQRQSPGASRSLTRDAIIEKNRRDKKELVDQGQSHGILVYSGNRPIGWCQFGPKNELPRIDSKRTYRRLILPKSRKMLWRITCFVVDKEFRRKGVAGVALRAALESIKKMGGGTVEAYPVTSMKAVGVWFGTVGMFRREGFRTVSALGKSTLVMRRTI